MLGTTIRYEAGHNVRCEAAESGRIIRYVADPAGAVAVERHRSLGTAT